MKKDKEDLDYDCYSLLWMMLEKEDLSLFDNVMNRLYDQSLNILENNKTNYCHNLKRTIENDILGAMYDIKKKCLSYLTLSENACCVCVSSFYFFFFYFGNQIQMA